MREKQLFIIHSFDVSSISIYLHHLFPIFTGSRQTATYKRCMWEMIMKGWGYKKVWIKKYIINKTASCIMKCYWTFYKNCTYTATDDFWQKHQLQLLLVREFSGVTSVRQFSFNSIISIIAFYSFAAHTQIYTDEHSRSTFLPLFWCHKVFIFTHFRQLQHFNPATRWWRLKEKKKILRGHEMKKLITGN